MQDDVRQGEPARLAWRGGAMLYAPERVAEPGPALFDPAAYGEAAAPVAEGGRAAAWFVHGQAGAAVLRRYRRGGLMARLGRRSYLWLGEARTRSFAEFRLMHAMWRQGLPVPRPLAAAYWRRGLACDAAILVERIAGARPLASALDGPACQAAALAIARMHRAGVRHADLNAHNVLLDPAGAAWLIDFDRGRAGPAPLGEAARRANLLRLRRSLAKLAGQAGEQAWQRLDEAYRAAWQAGA